MVVALAAVVHLGHQLQKYCITFYIIHIEDPVANWSQRRLANYRAVFGAKNVANAIVFNRSSMAGVDSIKKLIP
jgi:hypothetical protein